MSVEMVSLPMADAPVHLSLNTEIATKYCHAIRQGLSRDGAANLIGLPESTLHTWIDKGRDGLEPYMSFLHAVLMAEGELEQSCLAVWLASPKYEAQRDYLARRMRDRWSDEKRNENGLQINIGLVITQNDVISLGSLDIPTLPTETTTALPTKRRKKNNG